MINCLAKQAGVITLAMTILVALSSPAQAAYHFANFKGKPPIHQYGSAQKAPTGLSPAEVKSAYGLPQSGGSSTIAIIDAYADSRLEGDLAVFDNQFGLPACTKANNCLTQHLMASAKDNSGWDMETHLDVEWAHAIAPQAKILLVEAPTPSGKNLLAAIDYAAKQSGVVAVSMSWGGAEFSDETTLDSHFVSTNNNVTFFASSGDNGAGASWPAASPNVVGVGGTTLHFTGGKFRSETAWSGSSGGVSAYETEPSFQTGYSIPKANNHRAIPDVAYNADPASGFAIYRTTSAATKKGWIVIGGTSAGAPQWAAIKALGLAADNGKFYSDKASSGSGQFFRDVKSGSNGSCGYYCTARAHYDYVTGLGTPLTDKF